MIAETRSHIVRWRSRFRRRRVCLSSLFEKHDGEELLDCNKELQQCLQSSNDGETILFILDGILTSRTKHVGYWNFFQFTVPSYSLDE